jgi:hypothetical protein
MLRQVMEEIHAMALALGVMMAEDAISRQWLSWQACQLILFPP